MKNYINKIGISNLLLLCWLVPQLTLAGKVQPNGRERILFNDGWLFQKGDPAGFLAKGIGNEQKPDYSLLKDWLLACGGEFIEPEDSVQLKIMPGKDPGANPGYTVPDFADKGWRPLCLPHDWGIEGGFSYDLPGNTGKLPYSGVGWYRKHFVLPASDAGRQVFLDIDGAMAYPMVWLNGKFVGGWAYGYSSFRLDLTKYIKLGEENVLAIRVSNPEKSSRWYPGSGIYRNVWLMKTNPVHVAHWGTYITTPQVTPQEAGIILNVTIDNQSDKPSDVTVSTIVKELMQGTFSLGKQVASGEGFLRNINEQSHGRIEIKATVKNPRLWSPAAPNLYVAVTTVKESGKVIDNYETVFGIRTIKFDPDKGLLLNGQQIEIKGVCNHHDLGALGTAFNTRATERQLEILKGMGVNALRTSHNMPTPELLDLCDRMGIMVMDESFDCWERGKQPNDYGILFKDWHARDLRAEVRRDRNHPSVIMWSIGNEVLELGSPRGAVLASKLSGIVKREDPTRLVIVGSNNTSAGFNGLQKAVDLYGQNYYQGIYEKFHKENVAIPLLASETSSCVSSRGEYFFPVTNNKNEGKGRFQMSSYDLYAPSWGCTPDAEFRALDQSKFVSGEFVWTGFDYLGEPTPFNDDITNLLNFTDENEKVRMKEELSLLGKIKSPSRSSYFGIVDLCGFKKDRYYLYQARWRPELNMVHILPHWNWPGRIGKITPVHIYTSGDEVELFLNNVSLGRKKIRPYDYRLTWDSVVYQPGVLKATAYKAGRKWAEEMIQTTEAPARVILQPDRCTIKPDGYDLSFITVMVADQEGLKVPTADNLVRFTLSGPGEIVATDNGDATSFEFFQSKQREVFNGLALLVVRSKSGEKGIITLNAVSDGLRSAEIQINSSNK